MTKYWFIVYLPYATATVDIDENKIIVDSAPIFKWARGKKFSEFRNWVYKKKGSITYLRRKNG